MCEDQGWVKGGRAGPSKGPSAGGVRHTHLTEGALDLAHSTAHVEMDGFEEHYPGLCPLIHSYENFSCFGHCQDSSQL